jgi:hypothetical protein
MVPKTSSLHSDNSKALKESLNQDENSLSSGNLLPKFASESLKEDEMIEKVFALAKENEELRETLKHNNCTLQVSYTFRYVFLAFKITRGYLYIITIYTMHMYIVYSD